MLVHIYFLLLSKSDTVFCHSTKPLNWMCMIMLVHDLLLIGRVILVSLEVHLIVLNVHLYLKPFK